MFCKRQAGGVCDHASRDTRLKTTWVSRPKYRTMPKHGSRQEEPAGRTCWTCFGGQAGQCARTRMAARPLRELAVAVRRKVQASSGVQLRMHPHLRRSMSRTIQIVTSRVSHLHLQAFPCHCAPPHGCQMPQLRPRVYLGGAAHDAVRGVPVLLWERRQLLGGTPGAGWRAPWGRLRPGTGAPPPAGWSCPPR